MLESTEIFKHIDEEVQNEKRRIPPHDTPRVHVKLNNKRAEALPKLTPSAVNRNKKLPDTSPLSVSPTPAVNNSAKGESSQQEFKRKSRLK
mmetsp:Transcript_20597/g.23800  ORF Transcript_20597/g.23800 Transcript_20597/m.23800 type:complete len:91 (+) Transcript_20597:1205-1477(+)